MNQIAITRPQLISFCRRHHIRRLAFFGSVLRDDYRPDSDVDVLIEFEPGHTPGLAFFDIQAELSELLGRKVDLHTPQSLSRYFRDEVLAEAEIAYEQKIRRPAGKERAGDKRTTFGRTISMTASGTGSPVFQVDPGELHVPPSRPQGADPGKLAKQIAQHGTSTVGMPPLELVRGKDGHLRINDGVTRATRVAKLLPGQTVPAIIIHDLPSLDVTRCLKVKELLP